MTNETETMTAAEMFRTPGTGQSFYRPSPGQYLGTFVGHEVGPLSTMFPNADGTPKQQIRWVWTLQSLSGDVVFDDDGKPAEGDGLTSLATGPKSKAAEWFESHGRTLSPGDIVPDAANEIVGKKVMLLYVQAKDQQGMPSVNDSGRKLGKLSVVMPYEG